MYEENCIRTNRLRITEELKEVGSLILNTLSVYRQKEGKASNDQEPCATMHQRMDILAWFQSAFMRGKSYITLVTDLTFNLYRCNCDDLHAFSSVGCPAYKFAAASNLKLPLTTLGYLP